MTFSGPQRRRRRHDGRLAHREGMTANSRELTVFELWCRLTGSDPTAFDEAEREAFLARPQIPALAAVPYPVLLDAGISAARRGSLPLERWLAAVRLVRPAPV
jgi:hypothetical protein